jgi:hypothetical protein
MANKRTVSRPAQGAAQIRKPPRSAYKADAAPVVKGRGTVSNPKDTGAWKLGRLVPDATPRVVQR